MTDNGDDVKTCHIRCKIVNCVDYYAENKKLKN